MMKVFLMTGVSKECAAKESRFLFWSIQVAAFVYVKVCMHVMYTGSSHMHELAQHIMCIQPYMYYIY